MENPRALIGASVSLLVTCRALSWVKDNVNGDQDVRAGGAYYAVDTFAERKSARCKVLQEHWLEAGPEAGDFEARAEAGITNDTEKQFASK